MPTRTVHAESRALCRQRDLHCTHRQARAYVTHRQARAYCTHRETCTPTLILNKKKQVSKIDYLTYVTLLHESKGTEGFGGFDEATGESTDDVEEVEQQLSGM